MKSLSMIFLVCALTTRTITTSNAQCLPSDPTDADANIEDILRTLMSGSLKFSFAMLRTLDEDDREGEENRGGLFFSPYSVWSALMLTFLGTKGQTEKELREVLGTGNWSKEITWEAFNNIRLMNSIEEEQEESEEVLGRGYMVANRIYFQAGTPVRQCVVDLTESEMGFLDFASDPDGSVRTINDWVSERTRGRIRRVIPTGNVSGMVIANAVYFTENWQTNFDPLMRYQFNYFHPPPNSASASMMRIRGRFMYGSSDKLHCNAVELPYMGNALSLLILYPKFLNEQSIPRMKKLVRRLNPEDVQELLENMYLRDVSVAIPKFSVNSSFELSTTLRKMGIHKLFDSLESDLSDFATEAGHLKVGEVRHRSSITFDEEGAEAPIGTGAICGRIPGLVGEVQLLTEGPFVFGIRDNVLNLFLFLGTLETPFQ